MAIPKDTPVPTYAGWKLAGQLEIGDILFTPNSQHAKITRLQTYTPTECYELEFDDGVSIGCDGHAQLQLQTREQRNTVRKAVNRKNRKNKFVPKSTYSFFKVPDILNTYIRPDKRYEFSVLNTQAVPFASKDLPVPPYLLAIWLSIKTAKGNLYVKNLPIEKIKRIARSYGYAVVVKGDGHGDKVFDIRPSIRDSFIFAGAEVPNILPVSYLECGIEQRLEFLEGLMDSNKVWFDKTRSKYVLQDRNFKYLKRIQGLLESLGYKTELLRYRNAQNYRLQFKFFENPRKNRRLVTKITKITPKECVHIETGTQFLVGEGFVPVC